MASQPAWSIGTGQRSKFLSFLRNINMIKGTELKNIYEVPGPGTYDHDNIHKQKAPTWRFIYFLTPLKISNNNNRIGTAVRSTEYKTIVPGPGRYNIPEKIVNYDLYIKKLIFYLY